MRDLDGIRDSKKHDAANVSKEDEELINSWVSRKLRDKKTWQMEREINRRGIMTQCLKKLDEVKSAKVEMRWKKEEVLSVRVARVLREAGFSIEAEPAIGGLRPDFLVRGPAGQIVVVEAKAWDDSPGYISRAVSQAEHYKEAIGADAAFLVLPSVGEAREDEGVVSLDGVVDAIRNVLARPRSSAGRKPVSGRDRTVFAAMPFAATYDDVFFVAMAHAAEQIEATCVRVDQEEFTGDVVAEIQRLVRKSAAVVADLSESRPNVLYEVGYAHALEIPVVHICSTPLDELPFDVRNWNTIRYVRGQTFKLRERLAGRLRSIMR